MDFQEKVDALKPWYQIVDFENGIKSPGQGDCGEWMWNVLRPHLPDSLKGLSLLDLGCNTGIHCVRFAMEGGKGIVGLDNTDAPMAIKQTKFVRDYFEKREGKKFDITYLEGGVDDYLLEGKLGKFDIVFALSILHHLRTHDHNKIVAALCQLAPTIFLRFRAGSIDKNYEYFDTLIQEFGYKSFYYKLKDTDPHVCFIKYTL